MDAKTVAGHVRTLAAWTKQPCGHVIRILHDLEVITEEEADQIQYELNKDNPPARTRENWK